MYEDRLLEFDYIASSTLAVLYVLVCTYMSTSFMYVIAVSWLLRPSACTCDNHVFLLGQVASGRNSLPRPGIDWVDYLDAKDTFSVHVNVRATWMLV